MLIPHRALQPDTLRNLVEEFVTREGTDYGEHLYSLDDKVSQVMRQLEQGKVVLLYDPDTSTCQLEIRERVPQYLLNDGDNSEDHD